MNDLWLGFRFDVFFFTGSDPATAPDAQRGAQPNSAQPNSAQSNSLDVRFQKVKGLTAAIETRLCPEGGQNLFTRKLPVSVQHDPLVLERGMVVDSPLKSQFDEAMSLFKFVPTSVLVSLLNEDKNPISAWLFLNAYPVRWSTSDLDANRKSIVIDTLELAYSQMRTLGT